MEGLADATAARLEDLQGDVARLDSNHDLQKKFMQKELARVEEVAQDAKEKANGVQDQVDCVWQQTEAMTKNMTAMHKHSEELMNALGEMMQGFRNLRFDMPAQFEDWFKLKLGGAGSENSTISGEDFRQQWGNHPQIPSFPQLTLPNNSLANNQQQSVNTRGAVAVGTSIPPAPPSPSPPCHTSSPTRPSSTELYRTYLNHQSSQDDLLVELGRNGAGRTEGNEALLHPNTEAVAWGGGETSSGIAPGQGINGDPLDMEGVQVEHEEGEAGEGGGGKAEVEMEGRAAERKREQEAEVEVEEEGGAGVEGEGVLVGEWQGRDEDKDAKGVEETEEGEIMEEENLVGVGGGSPAIRQLPPPSDDGLMDVTPMESLSIPSPISPDIIRSNSVEPPPGLLTTIFHISPASSEPTIPSPSPLPNQRMLVVPYINRDVHAGPVTRSRSRSRSPSFHPPSDAAPRERTPEKKLTSRRQKPLGRKW